MPKILLVEDDLGLQQLTKDYLEHNGLEVDVLERGDEVFPYLSENHVDDYVIKPAEPRVLLARISALLRRGQPSVKAIEELKFGDLSIDKTSRIVKLSGVEIVLTSHEFELLWLLASNAGEVLSREHVHQHMIGREYDGLDRTVDVRVSRIRKKLGDNSDKPYRIKTVWGQGYLFVSDAWDM
jgi:DNA-binding response OmpR family regulator